MTEGSEGKTGKLKEKGVALSELSNEKAIERLRSEGYTQYSSEQAFAVGRVDHNTTDIPEIQVDDPDISRGKAIRFIPDKLFLWDIETHGKNPIRIEGKTRTLVISADSEQKKTKLVSKDILRVGERLTMVPIFDLGNRILHLFYKVN